MTSALRIQQFKLYQAKYSLRRNTIPHIFCLLFYMHDTILQRPFQSTDLFKLWGEWQASWQWNSEVSFSLHYVKKIQLFYKFGSKFNSLMRLHLPVVFFLSTMLFIRSVLCGLAKPDFAWYVLCLLDRRIWPQLIFSVITLLFQHLLLAFASFGTFMFILVAKFTNMSGRHSLPTIWAPYKIQSRKQQLSIFLKRNEILLQHKSEVASVSLLCQK